MPQLSILKRFVRPSTDFADLYQSGTTMNYVGKLLLDAGAICVYGLYADGVDITTHVTALAAGGTTVIVLPEGILHFRIKQEINDFWDWERVLVVSYFEPRLPWSIHNAMARNSVICGLSKAIV